jgi:hypothetical protein
VKSGIEGDWSRAMQETLSICLDTEMIKAIDVWAPEREIERSSAIRRVVELGLKAAPAGKAKR